LSMPHLWSTIRVSEHHSPNEVQFMHEWLSRAAAVPKTLFLGLQQESWQDGLDPVRTIFALYPFQKLSVFIDCYNFETGDAIVLPNQLLEHLEELNIDQFGVTFPDDAKLPNLQSLSLFQWGPGKFRRCSTAIPWSQIRHLTLSQVYVATHMLISALKQCLRLEYCKIKSPQDPPSTPALSFYSQHLIMSSVQNACSDSSCLPSTSCNCPYVMWVHRSIHGS
jgi:hypothetical protein